MFLKHSVTFVKLKFMDKIIEEFKKLPYEQKIEILTILEEDVVHDKRNIGLPDWQKKLLDERVKEIEENPDDYKDWKKVLKEMDAKYGFNK